MFSIAIFGVDACSENFSQYKVSIGNSGQLGSYLVKVRMTSGNQERDLAYLPIQYAIFSVPISIDNTFPKAALICKLN
jgi:hypothetical protein